MASVTAEGPNQFRVSFDELARRGVARLRRQQPVLVDPYLIGRAVAEVMAACTVRSASGHALLWNEYRVVMARGDFEGLGALSRALERDLREALGNEVTRRGATLVGELRVTVVVDEADELQRGEAVVRAAFVPTDRLPAPAAGEMTVRFDESPVAHLAMATHGAGQAPAAVQPCLVRWDRGEASIPAGATVYVGRAHPGSPTNFIALEGASALINKQQLVIGVGDRTVRIGRLAGANPVHVAGRALAPGGDVEVVPPVQISLSKGDLVLVVSRG